MAVRSGVYGNCLNVVNNRLPFSVLFQSTTGLFPALRKTFKHSTTSRALQFSCMLETALSFRHWFRSKFTLLLTFQPVFFMFQR